MTAKTKAAPQQSTTDRIEKSLELNAPQSRVWRALTTAKEFSTWFRMSLEGEFAEGVSLFGSPTHPGFEHMKVELKIQRIDAERYFAYRWHPYPNDAKRDYSKEPMTLVEFFLEASGNGTNLRIVESGFDKLPADRRDEAFRMNDGGWTGQLKNIAKHVS